jgi:ATP-dependent RNA helicase DDX46/PRP5
MCSQEAEQKQLELEMQKRRERIEQWRAARKPKVEDLTPIQIAPASRKWTLEDEDEDEEKGGEGDAAENPNAESEEVDPLDAYMQVLGS